MKRDVFFSNPASASRRRTATFALAATLIALAGQNQTAYASPPTPREVANHVHKRVSGIFFKVARVLEGGPTDEDEAYERERNEREREARYLNDRYDDRSTGIRNPELEPYTPPPPGYRPEIESHRDRDREPRYLPPHTADDEWRRREAQREAQLQQEERNFKHQQRSQAQGRTEYYTPDLAAPDEPLDRDRDRDRGRDRPSSSASPGLNLRQRGSENRSSTDANIPPQQSNTSENSRRGSTSDGINRSGSTAELRKNTDNSTTTKAENQPKATYATPVPNKEGFVYPPGVKQEPANMLDIRGLSSGQKARDPRTGNVFLVP